MLEEFAASILESLLPFSYLTSSSRCSPRPRWIEIVRLTFFFISALALAERSGVLVLNLEVQRQYMISRVRSVPNMTNFLPSAGIAVWGNEIPSEYIFEQGQNYLSAENCSYLYTGEWGDPHSTYGLDSQDIHYMGTQAENMPFVYYTPGYGYSQIPCNQYTYVPGAATGLDGQFLGVKLLLISSFFLLLLWYYLFS